MDIDDPGDFIDLQQQAEQLTAEMDSGTDLPPVERTLQQILQAGERLLSRIAPVSQDATDVKASILLGTKGYDIPKISQKLEGLSAAKTYEPLEPVRDTDIQGFLKNERENALLAVIEQTRRSTFEETEQHHWECLENEWEREKQKILNALLGSGHETIDFQPETESFLTDTITMKGRSNLDEIEMAYAKQVYAYNEKVIGGSILPNLAEIFTDMAKTLDDKNVSDIWEMVSCMVNIPVAIGDNTLARRLDRKVQQAFVQNAKKYLEQTYTKFITNTISGNLQRALLGGVPGTYNMVRSYLNIRPVSPTHGGLEDGTVDGHPTWAMIYYCLRCGDLKAAQQVVQKTAHQLGDFSQFLQEYSSSRDYRLSHGTETKIHLQYRRVVKNSTDPFKKAVYCVIGQCDPNEDHAEIADKIDDYLWLKLSQIQTDPASTDDSTGDHFTLQKLQTLLYENYGESHFNGYQQPFLYFQVLVLTAQFEAAIEFLSRIEKLRCHAVHVALVLYQLKLLLLSHTSQAQLLSKEPADPAPIRRLNFARQIMMYTRKFEETDPRDALQYFYFLRELKTNQNENLFMTCVSELVRETKEYEMLLGCLEKDGSRRPGAVDKFQADTMKIIELVARDTEAKGAFEDAVRLYDLAKKPNKVLELLNHLLSQVVTQPSAPLSNKDRLKTLAHSIAERYRGQGLESTKSNTSSFYLLLDLLTFFDLYHEGSHEQALEVIRQLQILPWTADDVEHKVNSFRYYTDEIRRSLPDILLATMNMLYSQYKNTKNTAPQNPLSGKSQKEDGGKETFLNYLRSQARAMIMFAGMLPYRLPGDTNARLVQIEVLMN
ncbi:hypothetical protein CHS0354_015256 [Potamilus streckersoni]|uniref:Nuclear pore protein n=1 Tax=Potamilus streckersoni TaxID=2493646 RepID=A0AAE0RUN0_9BIVA|nr:hypothetical protein CHS0354_015256 [Potamilus streckersoni]